MSLDSLVLANEIRRIVADEVLQAMQAGRVFPREFAVHIPRDAFTTAWGLKETHRCCVVRASTVTIRPDPPMLFDGVDQ